MQKLDVLFELHDNKRKDLDMAEEKDVLENKVKEKQPSSAHAPNTR